MSSCHFQKLLPCYFLQFPPTINCGTVLSGRVHCGPRLNTCRKGQGALLLLLPSSSCIPSPPLAPPPPLLPFWVPLLLFLLLLLLLLYKAATLSLCCTFCPAGRGARYVYSSAKSFVLDSCKETELWRGRLQKVPCLNVWERDLCAP